MLHPILGRIPTDFFRRGLPRAAFNEAPKVNHAEPPVLPTDRGADGAWVRRGANKALPRSVDGDQTHCDSFMSRMHVRKSLRSRLFLGSKRSWTRRRWRMVWLGSRLSAAAAAKAQLRKLPVGPATAAHDRVLHAQAGLLCVWAGA